MAGGKILLRSDGKRVLAGNGKRLLTRDDGAPCACCRTLTCGTTGCEVCGSVPAPSTYRGVISGLSLASNTDGPSTSDYINVVESSLPPELCVTASGCNWTSTWNIRRAKPHFIKGGTTAGVGFPELSGIGLFVYRESTNPARLWARMGRGGGTIHVIAFLGYTDDVACDALGPIRIYNQYAAATGSYLDPADGLSYLVVGAGGYVDLYACCPACPCPSGLPSTVAASYHRRVSSGPPSTLTGTLTLDAGSCSYSGTVSAFDPGVGTVSQFFSIVRQTNPCGWVSTGIVDLNTNDSPVGTYVEDGGLESLVIS